MMLCFSAVRFCSFAAVFFDLKKGFPPLDRRWMLASLARLGIHPGVL